MEIIKKICYVLSTMTKYSISPDQAKELLGEQICILKTLEDTKLKRVCYRITNMDRSIMLYVMRDVTRLILGGRARNYTQVSLSIYATRKSNKDIWDNILDKKLRKIFYAISNYYTTHTKTKLKGTNFLFMLNK